MPRKNLIRSNIHPYHITIRSNNKDWFDLPMPEMWRICLGALKRAHEKHPAQIHAFVLMQNHYHLLITTPEGNIDKFMFETNYWISKTVRIRTKRLNHIFGQRYRWSLIESADYQLQALRYVYQNPLKKNLSPRCEDYPFSTLYFYVRGIDLGFKLHDPLMGQSPLILDWINKRESMSEEVKQTKLMKKQVLS